MKYTPLTAKERFTALQSGEVDLLSRNTTWTSSRDAGMGMAFTGVTYYDGIGFLTHDKAGLKSAKELDGATVCIQAGTQRRRLLQGKQYEVHTGDFRSL